MPLDRYAWTSQSVIQDLNIFFNERSKDFTKDKECVSWDDHFGCVNSDVGFLLSLISPSPTNVNQSFMTFPRHLLIKLLNSKNYQNSQRALMKVMIITLPLQN